jgi:dipeptidase D
MLKPRVVISLPLAALMLAACVTRQPAPPGQAIANPASEHCIKQGGQLEIRQAAGGEIGICKFADGSECEEWALMRGECKPGQPPAAYDDPFAYCAAVGTLDAPDARYTGAALPEAVAAGLRQAIGATADMPMEGSLWRCADGQVKACAVGANLPCGEKGDASREPNPGIADYCKENPSADGVPAAAAGRATLYEWRCKDGVAEIVKQAFNADAQGFIAEIWHSIPRPGESALPAPSPDIVARAAMFKPLDLSHSALLDGLADWERAVLDKLVRAADTMDAAFWQQVDPEGLRLFQSLAGATDPVQQAARALLDANYGRWDRFRDFAPFLGSQQRSAGAMVFPSDLTKEELDAYVASHPDEKDALLSPYTVVRRDGDRLVTVPYHEAYAEFVLPAADLLDQAAALSQNASLARYLREEAKALRTDEYFDADMAWLDLDANLDVSIGPHETYDDQLTGQKAFYKANVLVLDRAAAQKLNALMAAVPTLQSRLPVPAEFRPDQTGTMTPLELADDVYRVGQARAIMEPVAFSLPNDPRVWEAKGAKKVMMGNYLDARRVNVLAPLALAILSDPASRHMDARNYFNWVLLHEVSHTLGPRTVKKDGQEPTVRQALGKLYTPIEEGKADIGGLYNVPYLLEQGILTGTLESHYVGFLSEALRSIRFGFGSAYGVIRSAAWNYFVEQGALAYDAVSRRFSMDTGRMTEAVKGLITTLLTIEGNGDVEGAQAFLDRYMPVKPELQALLQAADQTVPVEFVPVKIAPALTAPAASAAPAEATPVQTPLKEALATLEPESVWENFYALTQVPRPSHHEGKASVFLAGFGERLGLETIVDGVGNVIIRKPAAPGMENLAGVVLQAHMDMVPQKTPDTAHNFETDPIDAYVEGGWVKARGTTLGADDGIGVAMIMAVLQDNSLAHGPLEALFTVDEEDGFTGVYGLQPGALRGTILLNLDSEQEGVFTIGSAGGVLVNAAAAYGEDFTPADRVAYRLDVSGLMGGHSGGNINMGRGSASRLLLRLIWAEQDELDLRLASLSGGDRPNAIPRDASAVVTLPKAKAAALERAVQDYAAVVRSELAAADPGVSVAATPVDLPARVMHEKDQRAMVAALYGSINGVQRMSDAVPGLVESSSSMGVLNMAGGQWAAVCLVRSAVDSERDDAAGRLAAVFGLAGAKVSIGGAYSGWPPNPASQILGLMKRAYRGLFGRDAEVVAIHAGLETSVVGAVYPGMDMISVGPTLRNVHSPDEMLEAASVQKAYDLVVETLKRIPAR